MKILFHENQLSYRGTSNAVYNYALFNQEYLNNESIIIHQKNNKNNFAPAIEKFKKKFEVHSYTNLNEIDKIVEQTNTDLFYAIKAGKFDGVEAKSCKTVIHSVFKYYEPHGDVYAYVSEWLSNEMTNGVAPFVPHMIAVDKTSLDLRDELNIPKDAIVFGRHGGETTFDLPFVKKLIVEISKKRKDIYFVFMGTNSFVFKSIFSPYKNIIFLPKSQDELYKAKFINTCDAYLHARKQGESFGIAVGEFSICNKPVITWANSDEKSHIDILGDKAILYNDANDLNEIIQNFKVDNSKDWDAYSAEYSAEKVMDKFKSVFID
jgi:glycosyltransferase involved in cell wall biosynthesis